MKLEGKGEDNMETISMVISIISMLMVIGTCISIRNANRVLEDIIKFAEENKKRGK